MKHFVQHVKSALNFYVAHFTGVCFWLCFSVSGSLFLSVALWFLCLWLFLCFWLSLFVSDYRFLYSVSLSLFIGAHTYFVCLRKNKQRRNLNYMVPTSWVKSDPYLLVRPKFHYCIWNIWVQNDSLRRDCVKQTLWRNTNRVCFKAEFVGLSTG